MCCWEKKSQTALEWRDDPRDCAYLGSARIVLLRPCPSSSWWCRSLDSIPGHNVRCTVSSQGSHLQSTQGSFGPWLCRYQAQKAWRQQWHRHRPLWINGWGELNGKTLQKGMKWSLKVFQIHPSLIQFCWTKPVTMCIYPCMYRDVYSLSLFT